MQVGLGSERARQTLAALRARITSGEWPINSRIPSESELTVLLGVGRTTVREAVRSLASLGMLEALPGIGTYVRSRTPVSALLSDWISDFEIGEILDYRRALEIEAVQLAAARRTDDDLERLRAAVEHDGSPDVDYPQEQQRRGRARARTPGRFHDAIFAAAKNRLLESLYAGTLAVLRAAVDRGSVEYASSNAARRKDHAQILAAIEAGDVAAAAQVMGAHTERELVVVDHGDAERAGAAPEPRRRPHPVS